MLIHLNIGSNQGDRAALLERAVALLVERLAPLEWRVSTAVESAPWGFESPHPFLNVGLDLKVGPAQADEFACNPLLLLDITQQCERSLGSTPHRNADGSYRDRNIDIDIILMGDLQVRSRRLTVPHPHASHRPFVLGPLRELRRDSGLNMEWTEN